MKNKNNTNLKRSWNGSSAAVKRSWSDISVADFQRIYALEQELPEDRLLQLIAIVNNISIDDVMEMPLSVLESHFGDIDFLQEEPRLPLVKPSYELNGTRYRINMKEMTTAQYIDFKQMVDNYSEQLPRFLTIFLVPAGHRYGDGYDIDKAEQDISSMSITDARAVAGFFLTTCGIWIRLFLRSSRRRLRKGIRRCKDPREKEILMEALSRISPQRTIG